MTCQRHLFFLSYSWDLAHLQQLNAMCATKRAHQQRQAPQCFLPCLLRRPAAALHWSPAPVQRCCCSDAGKPPCPAPCPLPSPVPPVQPACAAREPAALLPTSCCVGAPCLRTQIGPFVRGSPGLRLQEGPDPRPATCRCGDLPWAAISRCRRLSYGRLTAFW